MCCPCDGHVSGRGFSSSRIRTKELGNAKGKDLQAASETEQKIVLGASTSELEQCEVSREMAYLGVSWKGTTSPQENCLNTLL